MNLPHYEISNCIDTPFNRLAHLATSSLVNTAYYSNILNSRELSKVIDNVARLIGKLRIIPERPLDYFSKIWEEASKTPIGVQGDTFINFITEASIDFRATVGKAELPRIIAELSSVYASSASADKKKPTFVDQDFYAFYEDSQVPSEVAEGSLNVALTYFDWIIPFAIMAHAPAALFRKLITEGMISGAADA